MLERPSSIVDVRVRDSPFPADGLVPPRRIDRRSQADRRRRGVLSVLLIVGIAGTGVGAPERLGPPFGHTLVIVLAFLRPERTRSSGRIPPDWVCRGQSSFALLGRISRLDPLLCSSPTIAPARSRRRADRCRRRDGRFRLSDRGVRTGGRSRRGPVRIHLGGRVRRVILAIPLGIPIVPSFLYISLLLLLPVTVLADEVLRRDNGNRRGLMSTLRVMSGNILFRRCVGDGRLVLDQRGSSCPILPGRTGCRTLSCFLFHETAGQGQTD